MPRKLRIQPPGALDHVINGGNYQRDQFELVGTAESFPAALANAVEYGIINQRPDPVGFDAFIAAVPSTPHSA